MDHAILLQWLSICKRNKKGWSCFGHTTVVDKQTHKSDITRLDKNMATLTADSDSGDKIRPKTHLPTSSCIGQNFRASFF